MQRPGRQVPRSRAPTGGVRHVALEEQQRASGWDDGDAAREAHRLGQHRVEETGKATRGCVVGHLLSGVVWCGGVGALAPLGGRAPVQEPAANRQCSCPPAESSVALLDPHRGVSINFGIPNYNAPGFHRVVGVGEVEARGGRVSGVGLVGRGHKGLPRLVHTACRLRVGGGGQVKGWRSCWRG
jgi:hypothetical protein